MIKEVEKIMDFVDVETMLKEAKGCFKNAIVLGYDDDDNVTAHTAGTMKYSQILWLIEQYKAKLLSNEMDGDD